jgi:hypothetical protein
VTSLSAAAVEMTPSPPDEPCDQVAALAAGRLEAAVIDSIKRSKNQSTLR